MTVKAKGIYLFGVLLHLQDAGCWHHDYLHHVVPHVAVVRHYLRPLVHAQRISIARSRKIHPDNGIIPVY